jgi:cellulose synthase/poly-beta-1,6-N-acetylglucosamine synthase-like glycosyltransferase
MLFEIGVFGLLATIIFSLPLILSPAGLLGIKKTEIKGAGVDVVLFAFDEPQGIIKKSLLSLKKLKGKKRIFLIKGWKDSRSLKSFCEKNNLHYVFDGAKGKARAFNNFIKKQKTSEYIAVFDCDERVVDKNFLIDALALFDEKTAYVQTVKVFPAKSMVEKAMRITNETFLARVQEREGRVERALFAGSVAVLSRNAIVHSGFFSEDAAVEDIDFSFKAFRNGYRGRFIPKIYALGKTPSFSAFVKQHLRYVYGNGQLLRKFGFSRLLLTLPALSIFNSLLILSLSPPACAAILLEMLFAALIGKIIFNEFFPSFLAAFINFVLLPIPRSVYFLLGFLNVRIVFKTTHGS